MGKAHAIPDFNLSLLRPLPDLADNLAYLHDASGADGVSGAQQSSGR